MSTKNVVVRYRLKPERVKENEGLVGQVYKQLQELNPDGIHYLTYKLEDGVTFVHIALYETDDAHKAFTSLPAFKNFQENVKARCEEMPLVSKATQIGAYSKDESL